MSKIKDTLKKMFCKHGYELISWYEEFDKCCNIRYSVRTYRCIKCGKRKEVDGRKDNYGKSK